MSLLPVGAELCDDRYRIIREVGHGGMQFVYEAHDEMLERAVALKIPKDSRAARKFRESAVISARVNHPNVAKTLDYFEEAGRFHLVEELVEGADLRSVGALFDRFDPHTSAHVLHHLARGLAASHRADVVHRDLKPSNIMVGGAVAFASLKITDFGIARMAAHEMEEALSDGDEETMAKSTTLMNQLAYAAPEVVDDPHSPSKAADVWAIAAIAWELLTGVPPFGSGLKVIRVHASGKKPPLPHDVATHGQFGDLSRKVHDVVMACIEVDPQKRPTADTLAKMCDDLCYLPPRREAGTVTNYIGQHRTLGFLQSDSLETVFFHSQSVVGPRLAEGTRVWFSKYPGHPRARAFPVVPFKVGSK